MERTAEADVAEVVDLLEDEVLREFMQVCHERTLSSGWPDRLPTRAEARACAARYGRCA